MSKEAKVRQYFDKMLPILPENPLRDVKPAKQLSFIIIDADDHIAECITPVDSENRIKGPVLRNGEKITLSYVNSHEKRFGNQGVYTVTAIEGILKFTYPDKDNLKDNPSFPNDYFLIDIRCNCINPKTGVVELKEFPNAYIPLRIFEGDIIVHPPIKTLPSPQS
jgi:hypothetical protein